jgi:putative FmdB family regulatory protein
MLYFAIHRCSGGLAVPLYEYECQKCGRRTEKIESVSGPHLKKCPHCGGKVERLPAAPAIQFKGSGWYVTDYAGKSAKSESSGEKRVAESKETAAKESPAKESASTEKKPAKKK